MEHNPLSWAMTFALAILPAQAKGDAPPAQKRSPGPAVCELKIEGQVVEKLWLYTTDPDKENNIEIDRPGPSVWLPAGKYALNMLTLRGGFSSVPMGDVDPFTLAPGAPHVLRLDATLKPVVEVFREGRVLSLAYRLMDRSGRSYLPKDHSKPPRFTVYQDEKPVAECAFEYG